MVNYRHGARSPRHRVKQIDPVPCMSRFLSYLATVLPTVSLQLTHYQRHEPETYCTLARNAYNLAASICIRRCEDRDDIDVARATYYTGKIADLLIASQQWSPAPSTRHHGFAVQLSPTSVVHSSIATIARWQMNITTTLLTKVFLEFL